MQRTLLRRSWTKRTGMVLPLRLPMQLAGQSFSRPIDAWDLPIRFLQSSDSPVESTRRLESQPQREEKPALSASHSSAALMFLANLSEPEIERNLRLGGQDVLREEIPEHRVAVSQDLSEQGVGFITWGNGVPLQWQSCCSNSCSALWLRRHRLM